MIGPFEDGTTVGDSSTGAGEGELSTSQNPSGDNSGMPQGDQASSTVNHTAELQELKNQIAYLKGHIEAGTKPPAESGQKTEEPLQNVNLFTPEELEAFSTGDMTNLSQGVARGMQAMFTQVMKNLPEMVLNIVEQSNNTRDARTAFEQQHPELAKSTGRKAMVKAYAEDIARANPHISSDELLKRATAQVYKELNIAAPGSTPARKAVGGGVGGRTGGTGGGATGTTNSNKADPIAEQVDQMFA